MSVGYGSGENRLLKAMQEALNSPLLNKVDMSRIRRLLYIIYGGKENPVLVSETTEINTFMDGLSENMEVWWGLYADDSLGDDVKVAIIATGFDKEEAEEANVLEDRQDAISHLKQFYYPKKEADNQKKEETSELLVENEVDQESETDISSADQEEIEDEEEKASKLASWYEWLKEKLNKILEE